MTKWWLKFKPACPHKMEVSNTIGMVIAQMTCVLDKGHPGAHCDKHGHKWVTLDDKRAFVMDKARDI